jgi:hypothetical protein
MPNLYEYPTKQNEADCALFDEHLEKGVVCLGYAGEGADRLRILETKRRAETLHFRWVYILPTFAPPTTYWPLSSER